MDVKREKVIAARELEGVVVRADVLAIEPVAAEQFLPEQEDLEALGTLMRHPVPESELDAERWRVIPFHVTDDLVCSHGLRFRTEQMRTVAEMLTGCPVLEAHDTSKPVLGRWVRTGTAFTDGVDKWLTGDNARARVVTGRATLLMPHADRLVDLYKTRVMNAVSIGFRPSGYTCNICGKNWFECSHWPFEEYDSQVCFVWAEMTGSDAEVLEASLVYAGASPASGIDERTRTVGDYVVADQDSDWREQLAASVHDADGLIQRWTGGATIEKPNDTGQGAEDVEMTFDERDVEILTKQGFDPETASADDLKAAYGKEVEVARQIADEAEALAASAEEKRAEMELERAADKQDAFKAKLEGRFAPAIVNGAMALAYPEDDLDTEQFGEKLNELLETAVQLSKDGTLSAEALGAHAEGNKNPSQSGNTLPENASGAEGSAWIEARAQELMKDDDTLTLEAAQQRAERELKKQLKGE